MWSAVAEFTVKKLSCRVKRATKLYGSVYDSEARSVVIPAGTTFTSTKQYASSRVGFVHVTDADDSYKGLWCPTTAIQSKDVISHENDDPTTEDTEYTPVTAKLVINDAGTSVYGHLRDSFPIPTVFRVGDTLVADRKSTIEIDGTTVTRYRIASTSSEDRTIIGAWITDDSSVTVNDNRFDMVDVNPAKTRKLNAMLRAKSNNTAVNNYRTTTKTVYLDGVPFQIPDIDTSGEPLDRATANGNANFMRQTFDGLADWYDQIIGSDDVYSSRSSLGGASIGRMIFVHGMPFQYTYLTDRRNGADNNFGKSSVDGKSDVGGSIAVPYGSTGSDTYGRSFAKEIAFNIPIAVISPGKPKFMQPVHRGPLGNISLFSRTGSAQRNMINMFNATDTQTGAIMEALDDQGGEFQYYSIEFDDLDYYRYVNSLSMASAAFEGIDKMYFHGQRLGNFRWDNYNTSAQQDFTTLEEILGMDSGVTFAFDPQGPISNTIQNVTGESMLSNTFNDLSSKAREMNFIAGYTGSGMSWIEKSATEAAASVSTDGGIIPDGLENVVSRVKAWAMNTAKGMNVRFPEIWNESNHAPSYEMECHFITPYATPFCIWRYVLVPFYHLFAMAAPQSNKSASQYSAPFLIKAYSKGYFNVEMGMIDSITWKRFGEGDMISEGGIPTQIDVTITFKDLYHTLTVTSTGDGGLTNVFNFMNNSGLMEMVGTLTGINMSRMTIQQRIALFTASARGTFGTIKGDFRNWINDSLRTKLSSQLGINKLS